MRGRLFSVGLIPALLGFFGAGGALQEVCCFAGLLMLPTCAWVTVAASLNLSIWRLNRAAKA